MPIVTVTINHKHFQIACNPGEEHLLEHAASELAGKIEQLKEFSPKASLELLLIMCALGLQDENTELRSKVGCTTNSEDIKLSETLSTVAGYLEELAKKITR